MDALIQEKIGGIDEIPSLPIVATRVMALMKDRDIDLKEISKAIMNDPALTLRVIRLANSAAKAAGLRLICWSSPVSQTQ